MKNQDSRILWIINIRTDRFIEATHPDIVFIDKKSGNVYFFDVILRDFRFRDKKAEKTSKYKDLALKISQM